MNKLEIQKIKDSHNFGRQLTCKKFHVVDFQVTRFFSYVGSCEYICFPRTKVLHGTFADWTMTQNTICKRCWHRSQQSGDTREKKPKRGHSRIFRSVMSALKRARYCTVISAAQKRLLVRDEKVKGCENAEKTNKTTLNGNLSQKLTCSGQFALSKWILLFPILQRERKLHSSSVC